MLAYGKVAPGLYFNTDKSRIITTIVVILTTKGQSRLPTAKKSPGN
jgi:hypothetical protein